MTWGFFFLLLFLGGFTLVLVTGLARRILHPDELCDGAVVAPAHEHWEALRTTKGDFVTAFITVFGLTALVIHGLTELDPTRIILLGAAAGLLGAVLLRAWMRSACPPLRRLTPEAGRLIVVRDIPAAGFGQVELLVGGGRRTMAARSADGRPIRSGTEVELVDSGDSVAAVRPVAG